MPHIKPVSVPLSWSESLHFLMYCPVKGGLPFLWYPSLSEQALTVFFLVTVNFPIKENSSEKSPGAVHRTSPFLNRNYDAG